MHHLHCFRELLWRAFASYTQEASGAAEANIEVFVYELFMHIGHAIQSYVEGQRFTVVRDFCGHGIGRHFHAPPNILHFGRPGEGTVLQAGMFFTIEPMVNAGRPEVKVLDDGWTAVTRDRSLSAQFEHMVGVTETGCEVFTYSPAGLDKPTL